MFKPCQGDCGKATKDTFSESWHTNEESETEVQAPPKKNFRSVKGKAKPKCEECTDDDLCNTCRRDLRKKGKRCNDCTETDVCQSCRKKEKRKRRPLETETNGCGSCDGGGCNSCDETDWNDPNETATAGRSETGTCDRKLSCGVHHFEWVVEDKCGKKSLFVSKIVSTPSKRALENSLQRVIDYIVGLYNGGGLATFPIRSLGLFTDNSTLSLFGPGQPLGPQTAVGIEQSAALLFSALNAFKIAHPTSRLSVSYVYRVISNELANVTFTFTITWTDELGTHVATIVFLTQMEIVRCGLTTPRIDWGQLYVHPAPPL